jgi:YggT family protein
LEFVGTFIGLLATILWIALLARVILSWFNVDQSSPFYPIVNIAHQLTEPILAPIRQVLPKTGMFDFSPIVAFILISLIRNVFS